MRSLTTCKQKGYLLLGYKFGEQLSTITYGDTQMQIKYRNFTLILSFSYPNVDPIHMKFEYVMLQNIFNREHQLYDQLLLILCIPSDFLCVFDSICIWWSITFTPCVVYKGAYKRGINKGDVNFNGNESPTVSIKSDRNHYVLLRKAASLSICHSVAQKICTQEKKFTYFVR